MGLSSSLEYASVAELTFSWPYEGIMALSWSPVSEENDSLDPSAKKMVINKLHVVGVQTTLITRRMGEENTELYQGEALW